MMQDRHVSSTFLTAQPLLDHLHTMMGPFGLYQHATIREPLLSEGYCTDDNARAISALLHLKPFLVEQDQGEVNTMINHCWEFVTAAQISPKKYYNFRRADGRWIPTEDSEDMYARLIRSYVDILQMDNDHRRQARAKKFLFSLLQRALTVQSPRAVAETVVACSSLDHEWWQYFQPILVQAGKLIGELWRKNSTPSWLWFEQQMTYANAILPHGILSILRNQPDLHLEDIMHNATSFLIQATLRDKIFIPIGSEGWYPRGGTPSPDNQQPIEAGVTFDFLVDYIKAIEPLDYALIAAPYLWLFGKNTHKFSLVDIEHGSCRDGLRISGPNLNCGAESLLVYLKAEARLREAPSELQDYIAFEKLKLLAHVSQ